MTREDLYIAIGAIRDELIERAETRRFKRTKTIRRFTGIAASLLVICGIGGGLALGFANGYLPPGGSSAGGNAGTGRTYMSYAGPVFPLTTREDASDITAEREINYDFSPYRTQLQNHADSKTTYTGYDTEVIVTDRYTLTSSKEKTMTAVYPVSLSLSEGTAYLPTVVVNDDKVNPELYIGPYSGSFTLTSGCEGDTRQLNLSSWEDYATLFATGEYMEDAFADLPALDQPVIVYEISDASTDAETSNPTLDFQMQVDHAKTTVLTYGMSGGRNDADNGYLSRNFSIPEPHEPWYGESCYIIVLGDDLINYQLQGYADGGCDAGEEIDASAVVKRYASTLGEIMARFVADYRGIYEETSLLDLVDDETYLDLVAELMYAYGVFSDDPAERYSFNAIEDYFSETRTMRRVIYLAFPITIPAGGKVAVNIAMHKDASIDFVGSKTGRDGYDMVTVLGSTLTFTAQYASISASEEIEIIDQNFGFDPINGITRVTLDLAEPHYWMDVRKRATEK